MTMVDTAEYTRIFLELLAIDVPADAARVIATQAAVYHQFTGHAAELHHAVWVDPGSLAMFADQKNAPYDAIRSHYICTVHPNFYTDTRRIVWSARAGVIRDSVIFHREGVRQLNREALLP